MVSVSNFLLAKVYDLIKSQVIVGPCKFNIIDYEKIRILRWNLNQKFPSSSGQGRRQNSFDKAFVKAQLQNSSRRHSYFSSSEENTLKLKKKWKNFHQLFSASIIHIMIWKNPNYSIFVFAQWAIIRPFIGRAIFNLGVKSILPHNVIILSRKRKREE